jgi:TRAP-type mannitol/chloroaromatic compound transport system substrate-binding protein
MTSRRNFMTTAAAASAAVAAGSASAQAQAPIKLVFQSAFPKTEMLHSFAEMYVEKVNAMALGRLEIQLFAAGTGQVVKAFDVLDAVQEGKIDGGLAYPSYWTDKIPALGLLGDGPCFGMNADMVMSWYKYGGGQELIGEAYQAVRPQVKSILCVPFPTQPLGWFKNPVSSLKDMKGLKYRTAGLSIPLMKKLGVDAKPLPGGEIGQALKDGRLDAAEFNNVTSDSQLGLQKSVSVCMLQSFHQASAVFELLLSKKMLAKLPPDLQKILEITAECISSEAQLRLMDLNAKSYDELSRTGVQFMKTPSVILQAQLNAWDEVAIEQAQKDATFKKALKSQQDFAARAVQWKQDVDVDYRIAYDHYWTRRI